MQGCVLGECVLRHDFDDECADETCDACDEGDEPCNDDGAHQCEQQGACDGHWQQHGDDDKVGAEIELVHSDRPKTDVPGDIVEQPHPFGPEVRPWHGDCGHDHQKLCKCDNELHKRQRRQQRAGPHPHSLKAARCDAAVFHIAVAVLVLGALGPFCLGLFLRHQWRRQCLHWFFRHDATSHHRADVVIADVVVVDDLIVIVEICGGGEIIRDIAVNVAVVEIGVWIELIVWQISLRIHILLILLLQNWRKHRRLWIKLLLLPLLCFLPDWTEFAMSQCVVWWCEHMCSKHVFKPSDRSSRSGSTRHRDRNRRSTVQISSLFRHTFHTWT
eukprot:comp14012_c0_seq1/m.19875 comp14012_c0_seq1/g.19875  ORF comp14012_c0_seq1/g.19875 comp14012_c0_seq1/m.19875 type:complete len:330 (-) comp14012_c0_seq1:40-1029(-)